MPSFDLHQIPSEDLDDLMKCIKALRKQDRTVEQAQGPPVTDLKTNDLKVEPMAGIGHLSPRLNFKYA
jgi:hypothetical protein